MSTLLRIDGLVKRFGREPLFEIERLEIAAAGAYVLTGVNGAGKSTLLRILAGLEPAHCARLEFDGRALPLKPYPRRLRDAIVYVHQHPAVFSTSVAANVGYGLAARGIGGVEWQRRVGDAIEWAGIAHLRDTPPARLSGGEKQRLALARARILAPQLLLLDEPTANLDGPAREQVMALVPALMAEGRSVVMACHDRDLIGLPAVQRLKLRDGRLLVR